ncbi:unnamed protein product [Ixodes pacificus]
MLHCHFSVASTLLPHTAERAHDFVFSLIRTLFRAKETLNEVMRLYKKLDSTHCGNYAILNL